MAAIRRHPDLTIGILAGLVFLAGAALAVSHGTRLTYADEHEYLALGRRLATSGAYSDGGARATAFRPPGWPATIAFVDLLGGGVTAVRLVNVAFFATTVVVVFALVRRIAGADAGLVAAAIFSVYPLSLYTATTLYPEAQALLLVSLGLLATVFADGGTDNRSPDHRSPNHRSPNHQSPNHQSPNHQSMAWAAVAGAIFGVLALTAPGYVVVVVPALVWLLWRRTSSRRIALLAVPLVVMAAIPPLAWGARNEARVGAFAPFTTNGGINLLLGNNPHASPTTGVDADISAYDVAARRRHLDEAGRDRYFLDRAFEWIDGHRIDALVLYSGKLANFFNFRNRLATENQRSALTDLVGALTFYPLLALFLVRLAAWRRWPAARGEGLLVAVYFFYAITSAVFTTRIRYRVPVDQLMIAVVGCGSVAWYRVHRQDRVGLVPDSMAASVSASTSVSSRHAQT